MEFNARYDARDGKLVWRFSTIARQGQVGGDTWASFPICSAPQRQRLDLRKFRGSQRARCRGRGSLDNE